MTVLRWIESLVRRPGESHSSALEKVICLMVMIAGVVFCPVGAMYGRITENPNLYGMLIFFPGFLAVLLYILFFKTIARAVVPAIFIVFGCVIWTDYATLARSGMRYWPFLAVLYDLMLVLRANDQLIRTVSVVSGFWLMLSASEIAFRWGMLDLPGHITYDERNRHFDCEKPPCRVAIHAAVIIDFMIPATVLLLDIKAKSWFAAGLQEEKRQMSHAITLSEEVAICLTRFDLHRAEATLDRAALEGVPEKLVNAHTHLLANLRRYRPYLPQSVLVDDGEDEVTSVGVSSAVSSATRCSAVSSRTASRESIASTCSLASLKGRFPRAQILPANRLQRVRGSLVLVTCDLAAGEREPNLESYVDTYQAFLSKVLDTVTKAGGVVTHFSGGHVHASFNAFRRSAAHATHALDAAAGCVLSCQHVFKTPTYAAVSTGALLAGHVGCETMVSPNVLGVAKEWLHQIIHVGRVLSENVVCSQETFESVSLAYPLRVLLHKIQLMGPTTSSGLLSHTAQTSPDMLYALDESAEQRRDNEEEEEEWMYAMAKEPGQKYALYNEGGRRWHRRGETAALKWLVDAAKGVDDYAVEAFTTNVRAARVFNFEVTMTNAESVKAT